MLAVGDSVVPCTVIYAFRTHSRWEHACIGAAHWISWHIYAPRWKQTSAASFFLLSNRAEIQFVSNWRRDWGPSTECGRHVHQIIVVCAVIDTLLGGCQCQCPHVLGRIVMRVACIILSRRPPCEKKNNHRRQNETKYARINQLVWQSPPKWLWWHQSLRTLEESTTDFSYLPPKSVPLDEKRKVNSILNLTCNNVYHHHIKLHSLRTKSPYANTNSVYIVNKNESQTKAIISLVRWNNKEYDRSAEKSRVHRCASAI